MKVCNICGTTYDDTVSFCGTCGSPLMQAVSPKQMNNTAVFQPNSQPPIQPHFQQTPVNTYDSSALISQSTNYSTGLTPDEKAKLIHNLRNAANALDQYDELDKSIVRERQFVKINKGREYTFFSRFWPFLLASIIPLVIGIIMLLFLFLMLTSSPDSTSINITAFIKAAATCIVFIGIGIALLFGGIFIAKKLVRSSNQSLQQRVLACEDKINEVVAQQRSILTDEFWQFMDSFPKNYQYSIAMNTIAGFFENRRADTLKEAFNLYEEQLHRWTLEKAANEAVELQRQQARDISRIRRSSAVTAGASVANAVHNILN